MRVCVNTLAGTTCKSPRGPSPQCCTVWRAARTQDECVHEVRRLLQAARVWRVLRGLYLHLPHGHGRAHLAVRAPQQLLPVLRNATFSAGE